MENIPLSWITKAFNKILAIFGKQLVDIDRPHFLRCPYCGMETLIKVPTVSVDTQGRPINKYVCTNKKCPSIPIPYPSKRVMPKPNTSTNPKLFPPTKGKAPTTKTK